MKLGIALSAQAYTPEAYAYRDYLQARGWQVFLAAEDKLPKGCDIYLHYMGSRSRFSRKLHEGAEIHEYLSLSLPPWARIKDRYKAIVSRKPVARVFLNENIRQQMGFNDGVPYILRDMGVDDAFYDVEQTAEKQYDIVYCGSVSGREGVVDTILNLAQLGLSVLVIGEVARSLDAELTSAGNVTTVGRVERHVIPQLFAKARYGLNITPDCAPFNCQTSTKTLEYCAAGLQIISNRYPWAEEFDRQRQGNFLWLDEVSNKSDLDRPKVTVNVDDLHWQKVLSGSNLDDFLRSLVTGDAQ